MRFRKLKKQSRQKSEKLDKQKNSVNYASNPDRVKAFITDMFMIYIPVLYLLTYVILNGKDDFQSSTVGPLTGVVLYGLISSVLIAKFGQTPGNKAYTMKVVDASTHELISFPRAFFRYICFILSATFVLGLFVGIYRKDNASLHDLIAKTIVIKIEE